MTTDGNTVETGLLPKGDQPMHAAALSEAVNGCGRRPGFQRQIRIRRPWQVRQHVWSPLASWLIRPTTWPRLMIVTQYAGSKTVKVYYAGDTDENTGTKAGYLTIQVCGRSRRRWSDGGGQRGSQVRGHVLSCWKRATL